MTKTTHDVAAWITDTMTGLTTPPRTVAAVAVAAVEAAGHGGGIDEVSRLARDGWPTSRPLDLGGVAEEDEPALRAAIQYAAEGDESGSIAVTYEDEHGDHEVSAASLPDLANALANAGYEGPRLKAYEGETIRGWVGADGYTWA